MIDTSFDIVFEETVAEEHYSTNLPQRQAKTTPHAATSLEEQMLSAVELAHSVSALNDSPQPLALIKVLGSLDSNFLSDNKPKNPEGHIVEQLFGIFF